MKKIFRCLSLNAKKKEDAEAESAANSEQVDFKETFEEEDGTSQEEKQQSELENKKDENTETVSRNEEVGNEDEVDPDSIQVVVDGGEDDNRAEEDCRAQKQKKEKEQEDKETLANAKRERAKLILAQIALAEESARLRRKEKREKKRMELSKYLGINAWKCDQKFLLNYGQEPEDIQERVVIIRKRKVKKERQRRIDEFAMRAEINAAARRRTKKA